MPGALVIAVIILVVIPVSVILTGALVAAILGWSLKDNAEATNQGSELIDLNV
jgi:FlaG/FlaF family flagellin (archaellin)